MNRYHISLFCIFLLLASGCQHSVSRQDKKAMARFVAVGMMVAGVGAAGVGEGGMGSEGGAETAAFIAGAGIALGKAVQINMDRQEKEARASESSRRGDLLVRRAAPYRLNMITVHRASFTPGSSRLTPRCHKVMVDIAAILKRHEDSMVVITGHADDGGSRMGNSQLSTRRAQAAAVALMHLGVDASRIEIRGAGHAVYNLGVKREADTYRRLELTLRSRQLALAADLKMQEKEIRRFRSVREGNLVVGRSGPKTLKLTMTHQAAFIPASAALTSQGHQIAADLARVLKRHKNSRVKIIGHASDGGSPGENGRLSDRRAQAVANDLGQHGVDALRIESKGMGPAIYVTGSHQPDTYRRVEIFISSQPLNLVGYAEAQEGEMRSLAATLDGDIFVRRSSLTDLDITLAGKAVFALHSARISARAGKAMKEIVVILKRYRRSSIDIIAHASKEASRNENMQLSQRRAKAAVAYLEQQGIDMARIKSKGVGGIFYATGDAGGADMFRRLEIVIQTRHN